MQTANRVDPMAIPQIVPPSFCDFAICLHKGYCNGVNLLRPKLPEFFCRHVPSLGSSDTKDPDCVNVNRVDSAKHEGAFTEQVFAQLSWALSAFRGQRTTLRIVLKGLKGSLKTAQPSCCSFWCALSCIEESVVQILDCSRLKSHLKHETSQRSRFVFGLR